MGRGSKNKGKNQNDNTTVYLKVLATYQCSKENCKRVWHSAHAWEREDNEGICCEFCGQVGELVDVVDEVRMYNFSVPLSNVLFKINIRMSLIFQFKNKTWCFVLNTKLMYFLDSEIGHL